MSEHAVPRPASTAPASPADATLWLPVLLRAVVALAFGAATVFWGAPSAAGMAALAGTGFVLLAAAQFFLLRRLALPGTSAPALALAVPAAHLAVAGVVIAVAGSEPLFGWYGAVSLALLGLGELYAGLVRKGRSVLARDWTISGVVLLGTAAVLPFVIGGGAHALLGVSGGGALVTGALWLLAALTIRHDAGAAAKAVN
ncbi:hypothetical protein ACQCSX_13480 [Pseudarthrobacter sp. P1]|uniref:hypothetical protein n=1 Tax=Pseudarthrobacter sp. P1 TaxID=3418418 RepID=UPI003CE995AA